MKMIILILVLISGRAFADIQESADFLCSQIKEKPEFKYEEHFSASFISKISYADLTSILISVFKHDGECSNAKIVSAKNGDIKLRLVTKTNEQKFTISLDKDNLMNGLMYVGAANSSITITDQADLEKVLATFPGFKSIYLKEYDSGKELISINSQSRLALGSEFKLYVLNLLAKEIREGKHSWSDKLKLSDENKSLPSGILHTYPTGSEYRLMDYAGLMISISDNTATDHLVNFLGQENIEATLPGLNSFVAMNTPFMKTMDLFRLRTLPTNEVENYSLLPVGEKRNFLTTLQKEISRDEVLEKLSNWEKPKDISLAEWYASTQDICSVMSELKKDSTARDILALNTPFIWIEDGAFEYAGYKGGSEPGVLTMSFLLKTKNQKWACLSMGINSEEVILNEDQVIDFNHAILNYSERILSQPN